MPRLSLAALLIAASALAGCGGDDSEPVAAGATTTATPTPTATATAEPAAEPARTASARRGKKVRLVGSQYGRILADGRGQAFYFFDKEETSTSECYGACARAWPPVLTKGRPRAGRGAKRGLLGTTRRRNGKRQVTYNGRPLYYYVDDSPGNVLCHNVLEFGGLWLVVKRNGRPAD